MNTENTKSAVARGPKVHTILAALAGVIGLLMLVVIIPTEDEPTAIPLFLIISAVVWYAATRRRRDPGSAATFRIASAIALAACFILIWLSLGVGIIGADGDPANRMYAGVIAAGIVGSLAARFRPRGMALTLVVMAVVQALIGSVALIGGMGLPWSGPLELLGLNGFFVALFTGSASLFWKAGETRSEPASR